MTTGHKHRMLRIRSWDAWWVRALRKPLRHTINMHRVIISPYPYGPCESDHCPHGYAAATPDCWVLTPLGILHRWTGLTLEGPDR